MTRSLLLACTLALGASVANGVDCPVFDLSGQLATMISTAKEVNKIKSTVLLHESGITDAPRFAHLKKKWYIDNSILNELRRAKASNLVEQNIKFLGREVEGTTIRCFYEAQYPLGGIIKFKLSFLTTTP